jgi:hypothetical protein
VRWLDARRAELLPIPYFHVVFTLPHALNALAQGNPRVISTLLLRAAAETLLTFGRDPRHLGGTIGVTAILHTWSQTLTLWGIRCGLGRQSFRRAIDTSH